MRVGARSTSHEEERPSTATQPEAPASLRSARMSSCGSGTRSPAYSPSTPSKCSLGGAGAGAVPLPEAEAPVSDPISMGVHSPEPSGRSRSRGAEKMSSMTQVLPCTPSKMASGLECRVC